MATKIKKATARKPATKPNPTDVSKKDTVLRLLRRQNGATIPELAEATEWQNHSVRGFLTATVKNKLDLPLVSTKEAGGERRYHIAALKPTKE